LPCRQQGGRIPHQQFTACPLPQLGEAFFQAYGTPGPSCSQGANCTKDLGAICVPPVAPFPWEGRKSWVQGQLHGEGPAGSTGHVPKRDTASPRAFPVPTAPSLRRLAPPPCAQRSLQTSSPDRTAPQPGARLPHGHRRSSQRGSCWHSSYRRGDTRDQRWGWSPALNARLYLN